MRNILLSSLGLATLIIFWELAAYQGSIDIQFYPPPHLFVLKSWQLFTGDFFKIHFLSSMTRFFLAGILSIPLACLLGIWTGSSRLVDRLLNPFFALTYPLPKVALFPLILLVFGLGNTSKIILIAIGMFYLIYINVRNGTKRILSSQLMEIVRIYKISGWNFYYHFLLKGILRDFFVGLKTSIGYGLLLVVVSELSASRSGIGHFIWQSWDQFRVVDMYAGIFILCLLGLFFSYTIDLMIERTRT